MFGLKKKEPKERVIASAVVCHVEGIPEWEYYEFTTLKALKLDNILSIEGEKKKKVILPFNQIDKVRIVTWCKRVSRPADAAGRALVGGLIGGDTGFWMGALSAQNEIVSKRVVLRNCLEIIYHPKGNLRKIQSIIFYDHKPRYLPEFGEFLCQFAQLPPPEIVPDNLEKPTYL